MRARRCVRVATTTAVMGDGDEDVCGAGARTKSSERVARKTMLGESTRRMKSGVSAASGRAMVVVAAVVAELDVVVGRKKEGEGWKKLRAVVVEDKPRLVLWLGFLSGRRSPWP